MTLINADSTLIPLRSSSVHLIACSPPYFNAREEYSSFIDYADYFVFTAAVWQECYRVLLPGGRIAVNVVHGYGRPGNGLNGYYPVGNRITDQLVDAGFALRGIIVWNKTHNVLGTAWGSWLSPSDPSLRDQHELIIVAHKDTPKHPTRVGGITTIDTDTFLKATSSIWVIPPARSSWHPAPFPLEIPRRLIELYTYQGDIVLDPFSGTGTTVHAAQLTKRVGIGLDLKYEYLRRSINDFAGHDLPLRVDQDEKIIFGGVEL